MQQHTQMSTPSDEIVTVTGSVKPASASTTASRPGQMSVPLAAITPITVALPSRTSQSSSPGEYGGGGVGEDGGGGGGSGGGIDGEKRTIDRIACWESERVMVRSAGAW